MADSRTIYDPAAEGGPSDMVAGVARRSLIIGASLGIPAAIFNFLGNHSDIGFVNSLSYLFTAALFVYMLALMLRRIFLTKKVTKEICVPEREKFTKNEKKVSNQ